MSTITCYITHRDEPIEIPLGVFEDHAVLIGHPGSFIKGHPPLVLLTTEGIGFAALYEVGGRVQVEMFIDAEYPALSKNHPVYGWLSDEHNLVDFAEVKAAVAAILPIADKIMASNMFSSPSKPSVLN